MTIDSRRYKGLSVNIVHDPEPESPFEWDSPWNISHRPGARYVLGNIPKTPEDVRVLIKSGEYVVFPVYAYVHGGQAISLRNDVYPFNDLWDAGLSGVIYAKKSDLARQFGVSRVHKSRARKGAENFIESVNAYWAGRVYGFEIKDKDGEIVDSCYGFYDDPYNQNSYIWKAAFEAAENVIRSRRKAA